MTDQPIIQASLVDVRNINTDKEVKLELRVPAELAQRVFLIFGWPTKVAPVSVAICPLVADATGKGEQQPSEPESDDAFKREKPPEDRQAFTTLPRVRQAGIRCREPLFWSFLTKHFRSAYCPHDRVTNAQEAAEVVRWHCMVESRRDLDKPEGAARTLWDNLEAAFWADQHGMH